ncbi:hypothetical protein ACFXGA_39385, partial [Actinosynnema sp. NPDC059335]
MSDQARHAVVDEDELGVGSASWRYLGKWRLLLVTHRALVLQGAHPAVGAAISQFSELPPVARWLSRHGPIGPEGSRPWHHRRSTPT